MCSAGVVDLCFEQYFSNKRDTSQKLHPDMRMIQGLFHTNTSECAVGFLCIFFLEWNSAITNKQTSYKF